MITLSLSGLTFEIPTVSERGYGEQLTNWIIQVNDVLEDLAPIFDIPMSQANLTPGGTISLYTINDPSNDRHIILEYGIYRVTNTPSSVSEVGTVYLTYDARTAVWEVGNNSVGDAGVTFTVNGSNQITATASTLAGTETTSSIRYKGRVLRVS